jgi:hypothetical protein
MFAGADMAEQDEIVAIWTREARYLRAAADASRADIVLAILAAALCGGATVLEAAQIAGLASANVRSRESDA